MNELAVPRHPEQVYADEWQGWSDLLGVPKRRPKQRNTLTECVKIAERLATNNGGILMSMKKLQDAGYSFLVARMYSEPEAFTHIKQEKHHRQKLPDHIKTAEAFVRERGKLPSKVWLRKNGHKSLVSCMEDNPEAFKHLPREYERHNDLDHHVMLAEQAAKKNNGLLPSYSELRRQGLVALEGMIRRHPQRFSHIEQERPYADRLFVSEHVVVAEKLAKQHDGILPNRTWLVNNGYKPLAACISQNKDAFTHLQQDKLVQRNSDHHLRLAEQIAKSNGGILPSVSRLKKDGHKNLVGAIYKRPELFRHIKREMCDVKGRRMSVQVCS